MNWETMIILFGLLAGAYLVAVWVGLAYWTWRDSGRRTVNPSERAIAVGLVLVFGVGGWVIYLLARPQATLEEDTLERLQHELLAREMAPATCSRCRRRIADDFMTCPYCREQLRTPCESCARPVPPTWVVCAFCGVETTTRGAPRQTPAAPAAPQPAALQPLATRPLVSGLGR